MISQAPFVAAHPLFELAKRIIEGAVGIAAMALCLEGDSGGEVDQTIHRDAYAAAIFRNGNDCISRTIEVLADTAREFILDACPERFADIHLPPGDLNVHIGASLVETSAHSGPVPPPKAPRCHK
jgi:hypothetical protein